MWAVTAAPLNAFSKRLPHNGDVLCGSLFSLSKKGYCFIKMHKNNFIKFPRYACPFRLP